MKQNVIKLEDFIRGFADNVNWKVINQRQTLSENFIRDFADRVDWNWIRNPYIPLDYVK